MRNGRSPVITIVADVYETFDDEWFTIDDMRNRLDRLGMPCSRKRIALAIRRLYDDGTLRWRTVWLPTEQRRLVRTGAYRWEEKQHV